MKSQRKRPIRNGHQRQTPGTDANQMLGNNRIRGNATTRLGNRPNARQSQATNFSPGVGRTQ